MSPKIINSILIIGSFTLFYLRNLKEIDNNNKNKVRDINKKINNNDVDNNINTNKIDQNINNLLKIKQLINNI